MGITNTDMSGSLAKDSDWQYYNNSLSLVSSGSGVDSLRAALPDDACGFAYFRLDVKVDDSMVVNPIILQWKGPGSKKLAKVQNNGALADAEKKLFPNKGFLEVIGKKNLSRESIYEHWRPESGSKVID